MWSTWKATSPSFMNKPKFKLISQYCAKFYVIAEQVVTFFMSRSNKIARK